MKKRISAFLLSLALIFSIFPIISLAASDEGEGGGEPPVTCSVCGEVECVCPPEVCPDCGLAECICAPEVCPTCGETECDGQHENWCEICKKDNCGEDHSLPDACTDCGNEECDCIAEPESTLFVEKLLAEDSLADLRNMMMAAENMESVKALTPDELAAVKTYVGVLYGAISEASVDDTYYYNELLETIDFLSGEEILQGDPVILPSSNEIYVNPAYNSSTEGYGTTHFSSYDSAYAYASVSNKKATIVIEAGTFYFDNNHKNYGDLAIIIKDGATMGNALSKWDMTYPVTVEAGGKLIMARPPSASVSNMHIKDKLTIGAIDGETTYVNFLSDTYQDGDMSIRYNGSVTLNNAVMTVQDLDAQGAFNATNSTITVDGAFASSKNYSSTLTNCTMTVGGTEISGGLSDFSGKTNNQLGKLTLTDSKITFANGDATNVVVAGAVTLNSNSALECKTIELNSSSSSLTFNDTSSTTATTVILSSSNAKVVGAKNLNIVLGEAIQGKCNIVYDEETNSYVAKAIQYTITYDLAGGSLAEGKTNPETYTAESSAITLKNPVRPGYTFAGWTGTGLDSPTQTVKITKGSTGDRSYTATWTELIVDLEFNLSGGKSGSTYLFTLSGKAANGEKVSLKLAVKGGESVTVKDLPVGSYTVTADNKWNWRETVTVSLSGDLTKENASVTVSSAASGRNQWFNGYADAKK